MSGMILVRPKNGLCNRLGVLASFAVLARRSGRELRVCWSESNGWSDEDLNDLFENDFARIHPGTFVAASLKALCLPEPPRATPGPKYFDPGLFAGVFDAASHPAVSHVGFLPCHELLAPEHRWRLLRGFDRDYRAELRTFRPVAAIRRRVEELAASFTADTIGVHIRRGDLPTHPTYGELASLSSDAAFMARMDRRLAARPQTTFFLATDCAETERRFRERYGPVVITNENKRFVSSVLGEPKGNQRDAVIDLFTLARTRAILGTYYSTYSTTAAKLGDIPLKVVLDGSWLARLRSKADSGVQQVARLAAELRLSA